MNQVQIPTTVGELRAQWKALHDLDRAKAVKRIQATGKSIRSLAKDLGYCSEAFLRDLLKAAKAPPSDRLLARQGRLHRSPLRLIECASSVMYREIV